MVMTQEEVDKVLEEANRVLVGKRLEQAYDWQDWEDCGVISGISCKGNEIHVHCDGYVFSMSGVDVCSVTVPLFSWDTLKDLIRGDVGQDSLLCPVLEQNDTFQYRVKG